MNRIKHVEPVGPRGAFRTVMHVARIFCVAPLVFAPTGVRVSRAISIIGVTLVIAISILLTSTNLGDVYNNPIDILQITWTIKIFSSILLHLVGAYNGAARMKIFLQNLKNLDKINANLSDYKVEKKERKMDAIAQRFVMIISVYYIYFFVVSVLPRIYSTGAVYAGWLCQAVLSYLASLVPLVILSQFILLVLKVYYTLMKINAHFVRVQENSISFAVENNKLHFKIRQIALSYSSVCSIVREMIKTHEVLLILVLINMFVCLEWVLYTCVSMNYGTDFFGIVVMISIAIAWCIIAFFLFCLIESCHRIQDEMERTRLIIWRLAQTPIISVKMTNELTRFERLVRINTPTLSPLSVCTLARPLLLKMIGALMSYFVTLLQLTK